MDRVYRKIIWKLLLAYIRTDWVLYSITLFFLYHIIINSTGIIVAFHSLMDREMRAFIFRDSEKSRTRRIIDKRQRVVVRIETVFARYAR